GIAVRGQTVNDVVHLLAELAENATSFSAADTPVAVSGHLLNSGGGLVDITDQGVGVGAEGMADANWRLGNPPGVDGAGGPRGWWMGGCPGGWGCLWWPGGRPGMVSGSGCARRRWAG